MTARDRAGERGLTLVELLVTMLIASLAVGFTFRIYGQSSVAYRSQMRVSELQQTLRTAKDLMVRDIRHAGVLASSIHIGATGADVAYAALTVDNNADGAGADKIRVLGANLDCLAGVNGSGAWNPAETRVTSAECFDAGDTALVVRRADPANGQACVVMVTGKVRGRWDKVEHSPGGAGRPWNMAGNAQCNNLPSASANDGNTVVATFASRSYRIKPADRRGVLQVSPSGEFVAGDWEDLALGFVDLQVALRVHDPNGTVDLDGDGDAKRNWFSSDNMEDASLLSGQKQLLQVRLSLVARTTSDVEGLGSTTTPTLKDAGKPIAHNSIGDRAAIALPVTDPTSRYHGNHLVRYTSSLIELRNLGIGL